MLGSRADTTFNFKKVSNSSDMNQSKQFSQLCYRASCCCAVHNQDLKSLWVTTYHQPEHFYVIFLKVNTVLSPMAGWPRAMDWWEILRVMNFSTVKIRNSFIPFLQCYQLCHATHQTSKLLGLEDWLPLAVAESIVVHKECRKDYTRQSSIVSLLRPSPKKHKKLIVATI